MNRKRAQAGLGLIELLAILAVIAVAFFLLMPQIIRCKAKPERIKCVNNLKNIGLAFRIFASDNNDQFPPQILATNGIDVTSLRALEVFRFLSNELSTPKMLQCPADKQRAAQLPTTNFARLTTKNISYFASLSVNQIDLTSFLAGDRNILTNGQPITGLLTLTTNIAPTLSWSKEMHVEQGDICMADGSVQQMSSSRLKQSIRDQDLQTNHLAFP
jgi:competence protein ComGC